MAGLAGEVANLIVALRLDDSGFSGKLNRAARALGRLDGGLHQVGRGVGQVGGGLARLGTVAATAAAGGLAAVVTTAASFEQAFTGVEKTVEGTDAQLAELEGTLRQMARTIPVSFEELSAIGEAGGALGIARDSLDEFIDVVARLSVSTNLSSDAAATALGQLGTILHLSGGDFEDFADSLVALGNAGASTEDQIVALAARFAAAGNSAGLTKEEILAISSAVASMGIEVEAGGTALSQTFNGITQAIGTGADEVNAFTDTLNISAAEFKDRWTRDALGTFQAFLGELAKLDQYEQAKVLEDAGITGVRQLNAIKLMTQNLGFFGDQLDVARDAAGALDEESQKFFDTTAGQWKVLVNNVRDAAAVIGTELLPVTNELIKDFVGVLNQPGTQAGLKAFAQDLAAGVRGLVGELRGTDFSGLIGGMKLAADAAKVAFDAFRGLPAPLQAAIVGLVGLNKISGGGVGLLVKGFGNILTGGLKVGGGLAGIFGGRGASPVNPLYVMVTNPGGIGGGNPLTTAGKAGFWGTLLRAIGIGGTALAVGELTGQSNVNTNTQALMVAQAARKFGATIDDVLATGATLGALKEFADNPELRVGIDPKLLAAIDELAAQLKPAGTRAGRPLVRPPVASPDEGERYGAPLASLSAQEFISRLATTTEIGLKDVGTSIEHGIMTGLDPFGQNMLSLAKQALNPKDPPVLREINNHIIAAEEIQRAYLAAGDLNAAKQVQVTIDGLHELVGTVDESNGYLIAIGEDTDRQIEAVNALKLPLGIGNALAGQISEKARLTAANTADSARWAGNSTSYLSTIAAKNFSPVINLTNTTTVKVSTTALQTQVQRIRISNTGGGFLETNI